MRDIFYPCIPYERNETPQAGNHYNCPMVTSYAENIKNNVEELAEFDVHFMNPFFAFTNEEVLTKQLIVEFGKEYNISSVKYRGRSRRMGRAFCLPPRHGEEGRGDHCLVKGA